MTSKRKTKKQSSSAPPTRKRGNTEAQSPSESPPRKLRKGGTDEDDIPQRSTRRGRVSTPDSSSSRMSSSASPRGRGRSQRGRRGSTDSNASSVGATSVSSSPRTTRTTVSNRNSALNISPRGRSQRGRRGSTDSNASSVGGASISSSPRSTRASMSTRNSTSSVSPRGRSQRGRRGSTDSNASSVGGSSISSAAAATHMPTATKKTNSPASSRGRNQRERRLSTDSSASGISIASSTTPRRRHTRRGRNSSEESGESENPNILSTTSPRRGGARKREKPCDSPPLSGKTNGTSPHSSPKKSSKRRKKESLEEPLLNDSDQNEAEARERVGTMDTPLDISQQTSDRNSTTIKQPVKHEDEATEDSENNLLYSAEVNSCSPAENSSPSSNAKVSQNEEQLQPQSEVVNSLKKLNTYQSENQSPQQSNDMQQRTVEGSQVSASRLAVCEPDAELKENERTVKAVSEKVCESDKIVDKGNASEKLIGKCSENSEIAAKDQTGENIDDRNIKLVENEEIAKPVVHKVTELVDKGSEQKLRKETEKNVDVDSDKEERATKSVTEKVREIGDTIEEANGTEVVIESERKTDHIFEEEKVSNPVLSKVTETNFNYKDEKASGAKIKDTNSVLSSAEQKSKAHVKEEAELVKGVEEKKSAPAVTKKEVQIDKSGEENVLHVEEGSRKAAEYVPGKTVQTKHKEDVQIDKGVEKKAFQAIETVTESDMQLSQEKSKYNETVQLSQEQSKSTETVQLSQEKSICTETVQLSQENAKSTEMMQIAQEKSKCTETLQLSQEKYKSTETAVKKEKEVIESKEVKAFEAVDEKHNKSVEHFEQEKAVQPASEIVTEIVTSKDKKSSMAVVDHNTKTLNGKEEKQADDSIKKKSTHPCSEKVSKTVSPSNDIKANDPVDKKAIKVPVNLKEKVSQPKLLDTNCEDNTISKVVDLVNFSSSATSVSSHVESSKRRYSGGDSSDSTILESQPKPSKILKTDIFDSSVCAKIKPLENVSDNVKCGDKKEKESVLSTERVGSSAVKSDLPSKEKVLEKETECTKNKEDVLESVSCGKDSQTSRNVNDNSIEYLDIEKEVSSSKSVLLQQPVKMDESLTVAETFLQTLGLTEEQIEEVSSVLAAEVRDSSVNVVVETLVEDLLGGSIAVTTMNAPRFNKLLRQLLSHYCSLETTKLNKHSLCEKAVQWARDRKSVNLRHELELTLMSLYYNTEHYKQAETIANALYSETKKLQDKEKTVKACLCLSQVYHAMGNISKARASITTAKTEALKIYTPPDMQGELDLQSGIMQIAEGKDLETAFSYFKEAATGFTSKKSRSRALKYMLLSKVMINRPEEGEKAVCSQSHVQDIDDGVEAMLAITSAANRSSLADFKKSREQYKEHLDNDLVVSSVLDDLYTTMMEKNLLNIVLPYQRIQIIHVAEKIGLPREEVERRLSLMILDARINAQLDHRDDCLYVYSAEEKDAVYEKAIETISQLDKTVSHLNRKVKKLL